MWYTREEQALVIGSFYSMNGFQQCVGGLIAYGISQVKDAKLKNWQILFTVSFFSVEHLIISSCLLPPAPRLLDGCVGNICLLVASG